MRVGGADKWNVGLRVRFVFFSRWERFQHLFVYGWNCPVEREETA